MLSDETVVNRHIYRKNRHEKDKEFSAWLLSKMYEHGLSKKEIGLKTGMKPATFCKKMRLDTGRFTEQQQDSIRSYFNDLDK